LKHQKTTIKITIQTQKIKPNNQIYKGGIINMGNNSRSHKWTFQNETTALSDGNILSVGLNMMTATITITGSGTNTVTFEGKASEDANYYEIAGINLKDFSIATSTSSKGVIYTISLEGLISFRVRVSNYVSGNVTAKATIVN